MSELDEVAVTDVDLIRQLNVLRSERTALGENPMGDDRVLALDLDERMVGVTRQRMILDGRLDADGNKVPVLVPRTEEEEAVVNAQRAKEVRESDRAQRTRRSEELATIYGRHR